MSLPQDRVYKLFDPTRGTWLLYTTAANAVATARTLGVPYSDIKPSIVEWQTEVGDNELMAAIAAAVEKESNA